MKPTTQLVHFSPLLTSGENLKYLECQKLSQAGVNNLADVEDIYPCSPMQVGLLVSQIKNPGTQYKVLRFISIKPLEEGCVVDIRRLKQSWQLLVDRHPILRTIFIEDTGPHGPFLQLVLREVNADIVEAVDTSIGGSTEVLSTITDEVQFVGNGVPHRLTIFSNTRTNAILCRLEINHAIDDGASTSIIVREWAQAYAGRLPPSKGPSYSHYIAFLQDQDAQGDLKYWSRLLAGMAPCNFPAILDTNTAALDTTHTIVVSGVQSSELYAFCRKFQVSLFNVLQAAWAKVLKVYTGMDEVCFGYLTSGRNLPIEGVEDMVGPLLNILICRVLFDGSHLTLDTIKRLQQQRRDNSKHQTSSLSSILRHIPLSRGLRMFNTIINFQRPTKNNVSGNDTVSFDLVGDRGFSEYDIEVRVEDRATEVNISLHYQLTAISDKAAPGIACIFSSVLLEVLALSTSS